MKQVAIIGTQGVPAAYGGFETLVDNIIGNNCSEDIQYTVFCSSKKLDSTIKTYRGANLKYIPVDANGIMSTLYDIISLIRSIRGYDAILVLGVSGGLFFPLFRLFCSTKLIVNIDGLEWKREKWGKYAKLFLRISEKAAVNFSDIVIGDNQGIVDYIRKQYKKEPVLIAYGGDHVKRDVSEAKQNSILKEYNVERKYYSITICRIEPENNCHMILEAFAQSDDKLLFIGNWCRNSYGRELREKYSAYKNISIISPIYDLDILYILRSNSDAYIHGHSAGGTNPSLVESMFCQCNIITYDVIYNRATTENKARYFSNSSELLIAMNKKHVDGCNCKAICEIAKNRYTWVKIAKQYEDLYYDL